MSAKRDGGSGTAWDAVQIDAGDNVAVALRDLQRTARVLGAGRVRETTLHEPISMGHKFALGDLPAGAEVVKYGAPIGVTTRSIAAGRHVHVHNLVSRRAVSDADGG